MSMHENPSRQERRQAAILKLLHAGSAATLILENDGDGRLVAKGGTALMSIPRLLVQSMLHADLISTSVPPHHGITPVGRAWLARHERPELAFRGQHGALQRHKIEEPNCGRSSVWRDAAESPLTWLRARRGKDGAPLIDDAQFAAGERLRADMTRAQMLPRISANWDASVASGRRGAGHSDFTDQTLASRQRVKLALSAVGPELSGILVDICCFLKSMETVEQERLWPARSGRIVLGLALSRLAQHYGLIPSQSRSRPMTGWRAGDEDSGIVPFDQQRQPPSSLP